MSKKLFIFMTIAAMVFAGCKKETNVTTLRATISGFHSAKEAKVYIDEDHYACWHTSGDQVMLNSSIQSVTKDVEDYYHIEVAEEDQSAEMFYSIVPASAVNDNTVGVTTSVTLPAIQLYKEVEGKQKVDALMAAMGDHQLDFKNLCALLEVEVTNLPANAWLTKIEVTTTTGIALCGTGNVTFSSTGIALGTLDASDFPNDGKTIKLQFDDEESHDGTYYVVVPPVSSTGFDISVHYRLPDATSGTLLYTMRMKQTSTTNSLGASEYGTIVYNMNELDPEEHLPGAFSIDDGVQIYFSRGNLLYDETLSGNDGWNDGWSFEQNQYTATEYDGNTSEVHKTGYIPMHFYKPHGHNTQYVTYPLLHNNGAYYGNTDNLADLPALAFGPGSKWRLLTQAEWAYLMAHANPTFVTVNGISGLMLFPDLFQWPVPTTGAIVQDGTYTAAEWSQLEDAGCVFLPSAGTGNKQGGTLENPGKGYYWSATPYDNNDLYSLRFQPSTESIDMPHIQSDWGLCVRLVYNPDYTPTTNTTGK